MSPTRNDSETDSNKVIARRNKTMLFPAPHLHCLIDIHIFFSSSNFFSTLFHSTPSFRFEGKRDDTDRSNF